MDTTQLVLIVVAAVGWAIAVYFIYSNVSSIYFWKLPQADDSPKSGAAQDHLKVFSEPGEQLAIAASPSPFCQKLETYCRLAGIPYTRHKPNLRSAPKGKMPYIEHSGNKFGDSHFIIKYLEATFFNADGSRVGPTAAGPSARMDKVEGGLAGAGDAAHTWAAPWGSTYATGPAPETALPPLVPTAQLSPEDAATAVALRHVMEDSVNQVMVASRWLDPAGWAIAEPEFLGGIPGALRPLIAPYVRYMVKNSLWAMGLLRHSENDRMTVFREDLAAVEHALAQGKARWAAASAAEGKHAACWFVFGARPSMLDAVLFALIDNLSTSVFENKWKAEVRSRPLLLEYAGNLRCAYYS